MFKLATILRNPGEPAITSQYSDATHLANLGYNGLVIYDTAALSGIEDPQQVIGSEMRQWIQQHLDLVTHQINRAKAAEMGVYLFYDVLSLSRAVAQQNTHELSCLNQPLTLCPGSRLALELSGQALRGLLDRLPAVDGVVLRFGDNHASRLPYLVGNDIYAPRCTRCGELSHADRIIRILSYFYDLVVSQRNQRLIARAWNIRPGGMHDSVTLCRQLVERLPGNPSDDRLVLSFKFTQTDFWRYQRWNQSSLVFPHRPIIYELQCQREYEGKGSIPNWQVPLWLGQAPEMQPDTDLQGRSSADQANDPRPVRGSSGGLGRVSEVIHCVGLWAWVRGGGWGGPFVKDESWIDANVFAVPILADDPTVASHELAGRWVTQRLMIHDQPAVTALTRALHHSTLTICQGFYVESLARLTRDPWNPSGGWVHDDLLDTQIAQRIIDRLPDSQLDAVIREKQQAVQRVIQDRKALASVITPSLRNQLEPLVNTLLYTESLLTTFRDLLTSMVAYRRFLHSRDPHQATICQRAVRAAQRQWNHHTQRHGSLPGTATAFRETQFWELTQQMLHDTSSVSDHTVTLPLPRN